MNRRSTAKRVLSLLPYRRSPYSWAVDFMLDCEVRITGKPQITTDTHKPYLNAVKEAFGGDVDYAMRHKIHLRCSRWS
jgi:hypothetical protein